MFRRVKRWIMFLLDPPWTKDGPENFTLAVPSAHSTFKRGDVGWATRPPAVVTCPVCDDPFTHEFANDIIDCPKCRFESEPAEFGSLELIGLMCPYCETQLDHGFRHPEVMDVPQWAACTDCQYHWEYQHDYST